MKFSIKRDQLLGPLQQLVRVVDKKQLMPVLSNVMIDCHAPNLILTATDLETQMVSKLAIDDIKTEGCVTIPGQKLLDICRLLPADAVIKFDLDGEKIKVSCGRGRYVISTLPGDIFPEFSKKKATNRFSMSAGKLKSGLDKTSFCIATGDTTPSLNGLSLKLSHSTIRLVASDRYRLALFEDEIGCENGQEVNLVIPKKAVQELSRLLDDSEAEVNIEFSSNFVRVSYKGFVFSSKLIDAKFPDFSRAFGQHFLSPVSINKQLFKEGLMRVELLSNEKCRGVCFDIENNAEALMLSANNPDYDEAEEAIAIDYEGDGVSIALNAKYMVDAVSNVTSDKAELKIASNASLCIIEEPGQAVYKYVVMAMRL